MSRIATFLDRYGYLSPLVGFAAATFVFVFGPLLFFGTDRLPPAKSVVETLEWKDPQTDARVAVRDRTARSVLEMTNLLLIAASVYVLVSSAANLVTLWSKAGGKRWWVVSAAVVVLVLLYRLVNSEFNLFWINSVPYDLFKEACQQTGSKRLEILSRVTIMTTQLTLVVLAADVAMVLAVTTQNPEHLGRQMARVRLLLYHAAVVLVLYSLEAASEVLWPASLLPPEGNKLGEDVRKLALGQALDVGVYNALMLALVFGPPVWRLTARATSVVADAFPDPGQQKLREEAIAANRLATSPAQFITNLLSVLSPLIAGLPLVKVVTYLLE
jgi:hypothetical protein